MAMSKMIKKVYPSVLPLAFRAVSSSRPLHGSIFAALKVIDYAFVSREGSLQSHRYSTVAVAKKLIDNSLRKVLRSEIKSAQTSCIGKEAPPRPSSFPFTIEDNPGERTITLTREFSDETIEVKVEMPAVLEDLEVEEAKSDDSSDDSSDDEENDGPRAKDNEGEGSDCDSKSRENDSDDVDETDSDISKEDGDEKGAPCVPMTLTISKADESRLTFEILASAEEIYVENVSIKESINAESKSQLVEYSCSSFELLESGLQRSLYKYLEIRGIKTSTAAFLHKYMVNKSQREDLLWMKKLRKFVKESKAN